jgi:hypothetical protein
MIRFIFLEIRQKREEMTTKYINKSKSHVGLIPLKKDQNKQFPS